MAKLNSPAVVLAESPDPALLRAARRGDGAAFDQLVAPYRPALLAHGYRMLGSVHDAEDLVQDTLVRAWRGLPRYGERASLRNWLYRIATNAGLDERSRRTRMGRVLPEAWHAPTRRLPDGSPASDTAWLEPLPDALAENLADPAPGPDAIYSRRESVRLAFVAAIQQLPARQRAILLLRDVLGWSAHETSRSLGLTVVSVNSALQRARGTLAKNYPERESAVTTDRAEREAGALIERYVRTWESANLDGFVALLREDATLSMPPWTQWYRGRASIRRFVAWAFDWAWTARARNTFRFFPIAANGQRAVALYVRGRGESSYHAHALQLFTLQENQIAGLTFFLDRRLFAKFGLPDSLQPESARSLPLVRRRADRSS